MKNILIIFAFLFAMAVSADSRDCFDINAFIEANGDSDESRLEELQKLQTGIRGFFAGRNGDGEIPSEITMAEAKELLTFLVEQEGLIVAIEDDSWLPRWSKGKWAGIATAAFVFGIIADITAYPPRRPWRLPKFWKVVDRINDNGFLLFVSATGITAGAGGLAYFTANAITTDYCSLPEELRG